MSTTIKYIQVSPNDCIPMKEMQRKFYDPSSYYYLRKMISQDGFKEQYAPRAIWNEKLQRYEIFDGIHRLKVAQDISLEFIPIIIENISRAQAIIEGYKANRTHAWLNTIDKAEQLKAIYDAKKSSFLIAGTRVPANSQTRFGRGNPNTALHDAAKETGEDVKTLKNYFALLELPEDVIEYLGKGRLSYSVARAFLPLLKKNRYSISSLAEKAISDNWSSREMEQRVDAILKGHHFNEFKACRACGKGFPKETLGSIDELCPEDLEIARKAIGIHRGRDIQRYQEDEEVGVGNMPSGIQTLKRSKEKFESLTEYARKKDINKVRTKIGLPPII